MSPVPTYGGRPAGEHVLTDRLGECLRLPSGAGDGRNLGNGFYEVFAQKVDVRPDAPGRLYLPGASDSSSARHLHQ